VPPQAGTGLTGGLDLLGDAGQLGQSGDCGDDRALGRHPCRLERVC
jgi:hypothetical protein